MTPKIKAFLDLISEFDQDALYPTTHEDAIVGVVERFGMGPVIVLDKRKIIRTLMQRDGMTEEQAQEFFEFNIIGAWMGEGTPAYMTRAEDMI
jgi:hypothetical protein